MLRRYWALIAVMTVLGASGAIAVVVTATPVYSASASLYFSLTAGDSAGDLNQGSTYTQSQMLSFAELASKPVVLEPVVDRLDLDATARQLAGRLSASSPADTVILDLSVSDEDPGRAAATVDAIAEELGDVVESYSPRGEAGSPTISPRVIASATVPSEPVSPNRRLAIIAGVVIGLVLGVVLALLRDKFDTRLRSEDDIRRVSSSPIVGMVQVDPSSGETGLLLHRYPRGVLAEGYRRIRANLQFVAVDEGNLSLVVTSSTQGDGKTTVISNLALALAETNLRTILVDADLRRPAVARINGIEGSVGLTTILSGQAAFEDVVQPWADSPLDMLASGPIPPNPSELLSSAAMLTLFAHLQETYDVVLIDTPPVLAVADAMILAPLTSGAMIVIDRNKARAPQLTRTLQALEQAGSPWLGLVVNRLPKSAAPPEYTYEPDPPKPSDHDARDVSAERVDHRDADSEDAAGTAAPGAREPRTGVEKAAVGRWNAFRAGRTPRTSLSQTDRPASPDRP